MPGPKNEQEYIDKIGALTSTEGDAEDWHIGGDKLVSQALRELGWGQLADAYDKAKEDWWYS